MPLDTLVAFTGRRLLPSLATHDRNARAAEHAKSPARPSPLAVEVDTVAAALQTASLSGGGVAGGSLDGASNTTLQSLHADSAPASNPTRTTTPTPGQVTDAFSTVSSASVASPDLPLPRAATAPAESALDLPPAAAARAWPLLQLLSGAVPEALTPQAAAQLVVAAQHLAGDTLVDALPEYLAPMFDEGSGLCGREVRFRGRVRQPPPALHLA